MNNLYQTISISIKKNQERLFVLLFALLFLTTLTSTAAYYLKTLYHFNFMLSGDTKFALYAIRELLFWVIFMLLAFLTKSKKIIFLGLTISTFPLLVSIFTNTNYDLLNTFIGFKITFLAWCIVNPNNDTKLDFNKDYFYNFIRFLLFIGIIAQLIHLVYGGGYNGKYLNLNIRNPNFFVSTSVSAYFLLVCYSYLHVSKKNTVFNSVLILVSLFLTNSTLGAILAFVIFADIFNKKNYKFRFTLLFYSMFLTASHFIRSQIDSNYFELTTGTRGDLLKSASSVPSESTGLFNNFGNYSSLAAKYSAAGVEPDSLIISLIGNLGSYYAAFFLVALGLVFFYKILNLENIKKYLKELSFKNTKITLLAALATTISFSLVINLPEISFVYVLHFLTITLIFNELKAQNDINNASLVTAVTPIKK